MPTTYEAQHTWHVLWVIGAEEYAFNGWQSISATQSFEGMDCTIDVPGAEPTLRYAIEMVSDIKLYRDNVLVHRFRLVEAAHSFDENHHTVNLIFHSYKLLLQRRILKTDLDLSMDQHTWAWYLVNYTQQFMSLGLNNGTTPAGVTRSRKIRNGTTIRDAIDDVAAVDGGFDWWFDNELYLRCQTPRRLKARDIEWGWGAQVRSFTRESVAKSYSSGVLLLGSQNTVTLPSGTTYPPPNPVYYELRNKPYGLWETTFSYPDIVTQQSLADRAVYHSRDSSMMKPTYSLTLEPSIWDPSFAPGDTLTLRVDDRPSMHFKVKIRLEEFQLKIDGNGGEEISVSARAESEEVYIHAYELPRYQPQVPVQAVYATGSEVVDPDIPTGLSKTANHVSSVRDVAYLMLNTKRDIGVLDRLWQVTGGDGTGGGGESQWTEGL